MSTVDDDVSTASLSGSHQQCPKRPQSPLKNAGLLSHLLFGWAWPLLKLGSVRPLEESDLPDLVFQDTSSYNKAYIHELISKRKNLGKALLLDYFKTTWFPQILLSVNITSRITQAIALGLLMEQFTDNNRKDTKKGYIWCGLIIFCGMIAFPTKQRLYYELYRKGMQIRIGLVASLYDKSLRLSSTDKLTSVSPGQLTNLASNDVERFLLAAIPSLYLIIGPLEAIVILIVGIHLIGPIFAVGHLLFFLLVPLQLHLGKCFVKFRSSVANSTDGRVGLVGQAVSGARIMKMNCWENEFEKRIKLYRTQEVRQLQAASRYKALNDAIYYFSSVVVAVFIFTVHVLMGGTLNPRSVYTTLALLNILHLSLTKQIPSAVMILSECYVSAKRIQTFLDLPEITNRSDARKAVTTRQSLICLKAVTCLWDLTNKSENVEEENEKAVAHESTVALSDISLSFESQKIYHVIGKVGCGKSALLQAIAGELEIHSGTITTSYSSIAYSAQDPWIMNGSIKENIIMGRPFQKDWYHQVIHACGLAQDIANFVNGDDTIVGDRGVQCSGGQKARIGLARTFYQDSQVLLLDDPLSAVDSTVALSIYQMALQNLGQKRGKCVILATHQYQFIDDINNCIFLDNGRLSSSNLLEEKVVSSKSKILEETSEIRFRSEKGTHRPRKSDSDHKEKRATGIVEWSTWKSYGQATGGPTSFMLLFLLFAATQALLLITIVEVGIWAKAPVVDQRTSTWIGAILGLSFALILFSIVRAQLSFHLLIRASKELHNMMLKAVLRAKISFFDTNPLGRILNRFSADVGINDETLPLTIYDFLVGFFMVLGGVITASAMLPFVLLVLPPLLWYFLRLRSIFLKTTRELKRLEGMSRSPIFEMMNEASLGISTIRANSYEAYFKAKFEGMHDKHTRAYFSFVASSRWFATRMDVLSFVLMSTASIFAVVFNDQQWFDIDPALLGVALTILLQIAGTNFPWIVRQSAEIVNQMVSVERVLEFGKIESEAPLTLPADVERLEGGWPSQGHIAVKNLTVRYRPSLPLALDHVSFSIPAGSRVGIVGRTGSGKSTIVQTLFRLLEAETGSVCIDGVDISTVGLHQLRENISVLPQSPTLFSGCSIRENLDLFGVHKDQALLEALDEVQLGHVIGDLPDGLDSFVSHAGSNFSVGQRQLLCLARASLKKNKILVLDEATASVDKETDKLLQEALDRANKDVTVIAIAHRLNTIIDFDYVLVLGEGEVLEYGSPAELLNLKGAFSKMVQDTGDVISKKLHNSALDKKEGLL